MLFLRDIKSKLEEIFMMIPEKPFGGFSVITVAHLLQLASVETKRIFSQFSDKSSMENLKGLE